MCLTRLLKVPGSNSADVIFKMLRKGVGGPGCKLDLEPEGFLNIGQRERKYEELFFSFSTIIGISFEAPVPKRHKLSYVPRVYQRIPAGANIQKTRPLYDSIG